MSTEFHRIKQLPPYVFESVNKLKANYRARGDDIIDLGMGNPDMATPSHIRDKLIETVNKPKQIDIVHQKEYRDYFELKLNTTLGDLV